MSDANREQMQALVNSMWNTIAGSVAEARGIDLKELNRITDKLEVSLPEDALEHGFVDSLIYEDQMNDVFAELGVESDSDGQYNFVTLGEYALQVSADLKNISADQVAIVYADGAIVDGEGFGKEIYGNTLAATLAGVRADEKVKAVVLRVNSPGGSALASMSSGAKWNCSRPRNPSSSRWVPMRPAADTISRARPMSLWPTN